MPQKMIVPARDVLSIVQNSSWSESRSDEGPSNKSVSPRQFHVAPLWVDEAVVPPVSACWEEGEEPPGMVAPTLVCPACAVAGSVGVAVGLSGDVGIPVACVPGDTVATGVTVAVDVSTGVTVAVAVTTGVGVTVGVTTGVGGIVGVDVGVGGWVGVAVSANVGVTVGSVGVGDGLRTGAGVCCGYV